MRGCFNVSTRIVHRSFPIDFGGDCVRIYYPHTLTAKTEALELFSVEKQLISSHSSTINLYHSYTIPCIWITSLLSIFLRMPYSKILVRDMLLSGVISNNWQYYDRNERESSMNNKHQVLSLGTRRCRMGLPQLCFYCLSGDLYIGSQIE